MRIIIFLLIMCVAAPSSGQSGIVYKLSPEEAVSLALENHPLMLNQSLQSAYDRYALQSSWDLEPAGIKYRSGELYGPERDQYLEVNQDFGSLLQHISDYRIANQQVVIKRTEQEIQRKKIIAEAKSAYYFWLYQQSSLKILEEQYEIFSDISRIADLKYDKGEIDLTERSSLITEAAHKATKRNMAYDALKIALNKVRQLTASVQEIVPAIPELILYETAMSSDTSRYSDQIMADYYNDLSALKSISVKSRSAAFFPQVSLGLIRQNIDANPGLWAWQVGLAFPVWLPSKIAGTKQARIEAQMAENNYVYQLKQINMAIENLVLELNRTFKEILFYDHYALVQANQLSQRARLQFENEEIEYIEFVRQLEAAASVRLEYLDAMNRYNQTAIQLEFYAP